LLHAIGPARQRRSSNYQWFENIRLICTPTIILILSLVLRGCVTSEALAKRAAERATKGDLAAVEKII
jgi:hypothetical protein